MHLVTQFDEDGRPAAEVRSLVDLNPEHPGFQDPEYRRRRDAVAAVARAHQPGAAVPRISYTEREHGVWCEVQSRLAPLHRKHVCRELLDAQALLPLDRETIPQLCDLNRRLQRSAGFRMEPVMGLVRARTFLQHLAKRVFLSTQYVRHHSKPLYTPEPDIVHELVGHAASLAHRRIAEVSQSFGDAAARANEAELRRIEQVYWYTMEFGVVEENREVKAFGAGLLSSAGELKAIDQGPALLVWDLETIASTPYDPTRMQPHLFVAPSFERMLEDLSRWLVLDGWRTVGTPSARAV